MFEDGFAHFPKENFLVLTLDEYKKDRGLVLKKVFKFLGVGMFHRTTETWQMNIAMGYIAFLMILDTSIDGFQNSKVLSLV